MMRRLAVSCLALAAAAAVLTVRPARAGSASATLTVQANVLGTCTIGNATLDFGNYDPLAALDGSGTITVNCTRGTSYNIGLGLGANAAGATRRMAGGTGEFLTYELYQDAAHSTIWTAANGVATTANAAGAGLQPYTATVYGRIPAGQSVSTGLYSDAVVMTVNF